ncbi:MAG: radical SAM protein [Thermotogae bacterium]|nr:radical SAM protein [Thermotogota bacterium]
MNIKNSYDETYLKKYDHKGTLKVALVYPNSYSLGMSNLGYHAVYDLLNSSGIIRCERFFYNGSGSLRSVESNTRLNEFNIVAFSVSFELDYFNLVSSLYQSGINPLASMRNIYDPIVICGGAITYINPRPLSAFVDVFFLGDIEEGGLRLFELIHEGMKKRMTKEEILNTLSLLKSAYIPATGYMGKAVRLSDLHRSRAETVILSSHSSFGKRYLLEIAKGCTRRCKFCVVPYSYFPYRFMESDEVIARLEKVKVRIKNIGLVSATPSDYPYLNDVLDYLEDNDFSFSLSSTRIDTLSKRLAKVLVKGGQKTITMGLETGSERLRKFIRKGLSNDKIFEGLSIAKEAGIQRLRIYLMLGLPTEIDDDIIETVTLIEKIQSKFGFSAIKLNVNLFVPKPNTPFERYDICDKGTFTKRVKILRKMLKRVIIKIKGYRSARLEWYLSNGKEELKDFIIRVAGIGKEDDL